VWLRWRSSGALLPAPAGCSAGSATPAIGSPAACDQYAQAIDDAHDRLKTALIEAGITVGLTTLVGADTAEVEAIVVPIVEEFETTVAAEAETPQSPAAPTSAGHISDVLRPDGKLIGEVANRPSCSKST